MLEVVELFRAHVVDVVPDAVTSRRPAAPTSSTPCSGRSSRSASARSCSPASSRSGGARARSPTARSTGSSARPDRPTARHGCTRDLPSTQTQQGDPPVAELFYDDDADLSIIQSTKVAVIGYGSQGHAHALNLRDSGVDVRVGLREGSPSVAKADRAGSAWSRPSPRRSPRPTSSWSSRRTRCSVTCTATRSHRTSRTARRWSSGTASTSGSATSSRPPGIDVFMVAPKGPGHLVRREYEAGRGVPVLVAVEQDASGRAWDLALSYAKAIGGLRAGRHQDHLHRGDRDRPVRRAGGALRRRVPAGAVRLRGADRGRATSPRSPTSRCCTSSS